MSLAKALPNLIVFTMLGGILYFGHHTGWKMPKLSALRGTSAVEADDWCAEHLVPESQCVECKPDLYPRPKEYGFCRQHGVAECVIDHPDLAQVSGTPQSPRYDTVKAISLIARPENNSRNTLHKSRVQFTSRESADMAGIDIDVVQERPMSEFILANGETVFDPTRVAHLSSKVAGTVAVVLKTIGDEVQADEILALVDSAQVGQAKSQLLNAIVQIQLRKNTVERLKPAADKGAVPAKTLIEAESSLQEAEIAYVSARQTLLNFGFDLPEELEAEDVRQLAERIRLLGLSRSILKMLPSNTKTANLIPVVAPKAGIIVASTTVAGEVVDTTAVLFTVADPRSLWLLLNVRQEDAKHVRPELPVAFRTDDGSQEATGRVSWISPAVDERNRTLKARVPLSNPDGTLRDRTFGTGRIILREEPNAIVVPREAVQSTNDAQFVFVRDRNYFQDDSPKVFHVRQIRTGARDDRYVELLAGVLPGEVVVTKGSGALLAQLLRSSFGAGCGCHPSK
jgi:cobalt-zinc-cadmium efflux system membrane fusion protein